MSSALEGREFRSTGQRSSSGIRRTGSSTAMTNSGGGVSSARRSLELIVISMFGLGVAFGYALGSLLL